MKAVILFFITFLLVRSLFAQPQSYRLSGSVRDSASGKPIPAVSVFLDGTSKGTITLDDGTFLLTGIPPGGYQLVISAIGYATAETFINTMNLPVNLSVALRRQVAELAPVTVKPGSQDGWNNWGGTFWDNFIGTTDNAGSCRIENRNVLRFHFNRKTKRLVVSAAVPLIIVNNALGYSVEYRFGAFSYDFSDGEVHYYGAVFFRELAPTYNGQERIWESARQRAYYGSMRHFMRSLYQGHLRKEGFLILHEAKKPNTEKERVKAIYNPAMAAINGFSPDSVRYYRKVIREPDYFIHIQNDYDTLLSANANGSRSFYFTGLFTVGYRNIRLGIPNTSSSMEMTSTDSLRIEENGNYSPLQILLLKGVWANTEMIANLLPSDYIPPPQP
jgi:CarboxypepD_reg-like domain